MTTPRDHVLELETRLKGAGVKIEEVLAIAHVDRSTWTRWKQGKLTPRMDRWMRVSSAAEERLRAAS